MNRLWREMAGETFYITDLKIGAEKGIEPATLALARQRQGENTSTSLPRHFHGGFRGSDQIHNLLQYGEPAGTRTQGPSPSRANEWILTSARYCNDFPFFAPTAMSSGVSLVPFFLSPTMVR